ncbi:MAG: hypothetical protein JWM56_51 [Candidatus Peribacteria bacterium]|nr:hypothetical protein [Candidatus Peribacteria bacterium]
MLDPTFLAAVDRLVNTHKITGTIRMSAEDRAELITGLELALVDRDQLKGYMRHLETHRSYITTMARDDNSVDRLCDGTYDDGLTPLDDEKLGKLALDPIHLWGVNDYIYAELPQYWTDRIADLKSDFLSKDAAQRAWMNALNTVNDK